MYLTPIPSPVGSGGKGEDHSEGSCRPLRVMRPGSVHGRGLHTPERPAGSPDMGVPPRHATDPGWGDPVPVMYPTPWTGTAPLGTAYGPMGGWGDCRNPDMMHRNKCRDSDTRPGPHHTTRDG